MVQCTGFPSNFLIVIFGNLTLLSLDLGCTDTVPFCSGGLFLGMFLMCDLWQLHKLLHMATDNQLFV